MGTKTPVTLTGAAAEMVERVYEMYRMLGKERSKAKIVEEAVMAYMPKVLERLDFEIRSKVSNNKDESIKRVLFGKEPEFVMW